jgi:hypothetical protein
MEGGHKRALFDAAWVHNYNDKYYFFYSTGDTHLLCYATGDNPYGPFTYRKRWKAIEDNCSDVFYCLQLFSI